MAVWIKVTKDSAKQDQVQSTLNTTDHSVTQQVIQTWIAISDSTPVAGVYPAQVTPIEAEVATVGGLAIPLIGGAYTIGGQAGFICIRRMPKRHAGNPYLFEIEVEYTRKFITKPTSATKWNTSVSFGGEKFQQDAYKDKDNKAIQNSAGQYLSPTLKKTFYDERIDVTFNGTSAASAAVAPLRGMVNSSSVTFTINGESRTFPTRSLLLEEATMSSSVASDDGSTPVWTIKLSLINRTDTFVSHVLDQGFMQLDSGTKLVNIKDKWGENISQPARLDSSGQAITDPTAASHYIDFKIEGEADLSPLFAGLT